MRLVYAKVYSFTSDRRCILMMLRMSRVIIGCLFTRTGIVVFRSDFVTFIGNAVVIVALFTPPHFRVVLNKSDERKRRKM